MTQDLHERVGQALNQVYDPCSVASNAPLGLIDMGLVRHWSVDASGHVDVTLCTTGPGCMMAGNIMRAAVERLEQEPGVVHVALAFDTAFQWTPDAMSRDGAIRIAAARARATPNPPLRYQQHASG